MDSASDKAEAFLRATRLADEKVLDQFRREADSVAGPHEVETLVGNLLACAAGLILGQSWEQLQWYAGMIVDALEALSAAWAEQVKVALEPGRQEPFGAHADSAIRERLHALIEELDLKTAEVAQVRGERRLLEGEA